MQARPRRLYVAIALGLVTSVLAYVVLRVGEALLFPEADPAIIIWSDRSRYGWRVLIAAYLGGAAVFVPYALVKVSLERLSLGLLRLVVVAAAALLVLGALVP